MFGHVLIIDAMSNRRIQLRASLGTRCENVVLADCYADGVKSRQSNPPDVLIIGQDTPGLDLARLCRSLKARSDTQMVRVIVAVSSETASARYAALFPLF